jgi:Flp pilus assembly protein TadD
MKTKVQKTLLLVVVLGLLLLGGGYAGYRGYKSVRQTRLIRQAREFLAKPDPRKALLCLQRALRYNSRDIEACRLMAQLAEAGRSPAAMFYRSRVVELNPGSTDDRLALAQTAMTFRDYTSATNALEGVDAAGKKTVAYHNIAGAVAAAANQPAAAEAHFLEAARLEPQNPILQLNLSVVRLHGTNAAALAEARSALTRISANPTNSTLRCQALRELAVDAMRQKQSEAALALSKQLLQETNSVFRDRLLRLEVLRDTKSAGYKPALATLQREAASEPGKTAELGMWQMGNTSPAENLAWLRSLPLSTQTNQAVAMMMADCYTMLRDWRGLQASVDPQNWGELEFIRHAFKARALRGQDLSGAAKGEWELALKVANNQKASLVMLLRLAAAWNWQSEGEELLWTIVNRYPGEKWAFQALTQVLFAGGRTRPLMTFFIQELKRSPSDLAIKNNLAMTALLLEAKELKPHDLAREVYQKAPNNATYASTYAFSLYLQGKNAEALKVFQTLKPQELENTSIAGYYGLILKATGNKEKARVYLDWAFKSPMLPEERKLFERAKAGM